MVAGFLFHREEPVAQAYLDHASLESPFGWAAAALGQVSPTLQDLDAVAFARFRPHLRLARQPMAPQQTSAPYTVEDARKDLEPMGASDANLAHPGEQVAEALLLLSISLPTIKPTIHFSSVLGGLTELAIRTIDKFGKADLGAADGL